MSINDPATPGGSDLPDALRWQLRALRQDVAPPEALWERVAPRLTAREGGAARPRVPWMGLAASVLLMVGMAGLWQGRGAEEQPEPERVALAEARRLSNDYRQALDALPAAGARVPVLAPALDELDRSAAQIRRALDHDPDSRLLLEQLRRTYARRLELSQRALVG